MKGKIALIDDDSAIVEAFTIALKGFGYHAEQIIANTNGEILKKIEEFQPNLIVLDLSLPGLDGKTICSDLKANPSTKPIPILISSAHSDAKDESLKAGANDFIAKPFNLTDLIEKINKLISENSAM